MKIIEFKISYFILNVLRAIKIITNNKKFIIKIKIFRIISKYLTRLKLLKVDSHENKFQSYLLIKLKFSTLYLTLDNRCIVQYLVKHPLCLIYISFKMLQKVEGQCESHN